MRSDEHRAREIARQDKAAAEFIRKRDEAIAEQRKRDAQRDKDARGLAKQLKDIAESMQRDEVQARQARRKGDR